MIVRSDAVVLRVRPYSDTSRIASLYTREHGRVSVIARGAMRPKSRLGALLQPMSRISALYYRREGRDLHTLSEADTLGRYATIPTSIDRMVAGLAVVEQTEAAVHEDDRNDTLYTVLTQALDALDDPRCDPAVVHPWFQLHMLEALGFGLRSDACGVCDERVEPAHAHAVFSVSLGAPLCSEHRSSAPGRNVDWNVLKLVGRLERLERLGLEGVEVSPVHATAALDLLVDYTRGHIEGMRRGNVRSVGAMLTGNATS